MDPHKRSATIEVMAGDEAVLGGGRYGTDLAGYRAMLVYARRFPQRTWAIEGCQGIGRHVANRLLADGEQVDFQTVKGADTVGRESGGQNVAIGLTGLPDVPAKRTGVTVRWKSHWLSSAAVVAHTSRSQLSSSHRPIATRLTA